jgi:hypothetical protein
MTQIGKWRTAILAALCGSSRIVPAQHFAEQLGRPLNRTEFGALERAIHSLAERGDVCVSFTSLHEGRPRRLVVCTPEACQAAERRRGAG